MKHPDEDGGFWTEVPVLPGCGFQGDSLEEAIEMTRDAIEGAPEMLNDYGEPIPEDNGDMVVKVQVPG